MRDTTNEHLSQSGLKSSLFHWIYNLQMQLFSLFIAASYGHQNSRGEKIKGIVWILMKRISYKRYLAGILLSAGDLLGCFLLQQMLRISKNNSVPSWLHPSPRDHSKHLVP